MHRDVVDNHWGAGIQVLVKRIPADAPYEGNTSGSYRFTTEPHPDEDCPFTDGPILHMVAVPMPPANPPCSETGLLAVPIGPRT